MTHPSPTSGSEPQGFDLLHRGVQRWIWEQRWRALRDIQERAIAPTLRGDTDVLVAAATAGGKTEAAFLPVCSVLAGADSTGIQAVYLSPLKALINDQHDRLSGLCSRVGIAVTPWHGDVGTARKNRLRESPSGILLITPESLEAMFVRHGTALPALFTDLRYVVVDELHAFLGTARGAQVRSLLHRLEGVAGRRVARIGLSATLADLGSAAEFLRPGGGRRVTVIEDTAAGKEVRIQVRGYVDDLRLDAGARGCEAVARHLYGVVRDGHNLVFANSRAAVEVYASQLSARAHEDRIPDPFLPHHGSLSRELRTAAEERLKRRSDPATVVCTSTLELGIDVGWVDTVAQIGVPPSVAGLRQRLGRSGRGETPARLYVYVTEQSAPQTPTEWLRAGLVQTAATIDLLLRRWFEPPDLRAPHYSTLVQQVLSVLGQHSGATADRLYSELCARGGFPGVSPERFAVLLRGLGANGLISQESSGLLLPGPVGERLLNHYTFYAAFETNQEYEVVASGEKVGTVAVGPRTDEGALLAFGGRTWRVVRVDSTAHQVLVTPAGGAGLPPGFLGAAVPVGDGVRQRMREIYTETGTPRYLDDAAAILLEEGRAAFQDLGLATSRLYQQGGDLLAFPWKGDRVIETLCHLLGQAGVEAAGGPGLVFLHGMTVAGFRRVAGALTAKAPPDPLALAERVADKRLNKYDTYLPEELLTRAYADQALDVEGAMAFLRAVTTERV